MQLDWNYNKPDSESVLHFLQAEGIPRNFLKSVKFEGQILVNQEAVNVRRMLTAGDQLALIAPWEMGHDTVPASDLPIEVVYEDRDILVVNKPSNCVSIPSRQDPDSSMANRIKGYYQRNGYKDQVIHIVTRLDRDTTGLMLIGKHRLAHAYMDRQIQAGKISKVYFALSEGKVWDEHGLIDLPIARNPESIISRLVDSKTGQHALTEYWLEERLDQATLLRLQLHTGRTHQIRVHLSHLGGPLVGDDLYGGQVYPELQRQALHCGQLTFIHPFTHEEIHLEQPIAQDMVDWMRIHRRR